MSRKGVKFNSNLYQENFLTPSYANEYKNIKKEHNKINLMEQARNWKIVKYSPVQKYINPLNYPIGTVSKNTNYSQRYENPIPYSIHNKKPVVNPFNYPIELGGKKTKSKIVRKTVRKTVRQTVRQTVRKTVRKTDKK